MTKFCCICQKYFGPGLFIWIRRIAVDEGHGNLLDYFLFLLPQICRTAGPGVKTQKFQVSHYA